MKRQFLLILAFASLAALLGAQSPSPPPTPSATTQEQQEISRNESPQPSPSNAVTEATPPAVNQPTSSPTAQASEASSRENSKKSSFDYNALAVTIFTGVLAFLAWLQLKAMRQQAEYMRDGLRETKKAADAATTSADAAMMAANAAEESIRLARDSARIEQRAWVAPIEFHSDVIIGQTFAAKVTFKNTGLTFAMNVGIKFMIQIVPSAVEPDFDEAEKDLIIESWAILAPGGICFGGEATDTGYVLTKERIENIISGATSIYVHGRVEYADVFKRPHWTSYCVKLLTDGKLITYAAHGTRNKTDDS